MLKQFLSTFSSFDSFLRWQLLVGFLGSIAWALTIPIIHKLQGLYWTTAYISIAHIANNSSGLIVPFLKGMSLPSLMLLYIGVSFIYLISIYLYFINIELFLIVEAVISLSFCVLFPLLNIAWEVYVIKRYGVNVFEDFRYWEGVRSSLGHIFGAGLVLLVSMHFDIKMSLKLMSVAIVMMLIIELLNWFKFYRGMDRGG